MVELREPLERSEEFLPSRVGTAPTPLAERILTEVQLLHRKVDMLERLSVGRPLGIIRLSESCDLPVHKVRYVLHLLERQGAVQPSAEGAVVTDLAASYWVRLDSHLDTILAELQQLKQIVVEHRNRVSARRSGPWVR